MAKGKESGAMLSVKAYLTEASAWEQLKTWKRRADMEKRRGVLKAETIVGLNRAYLVLKTIQINGKGKENEKAS